MSGAAVSDPEVSSRDIAAVLERIAAARAEIGSIIMGQSRVVDLTPDGAARRRSRPC